VDALIWYLPAVVGWALATRFFWRAGAWLPYYVVGAAGGAVLAVVAARELVPGELAIRVATAYAVHHLSWLLGIHTELFDDRAGELLVVGVPHHQEWTRLTIGIECSGLLELAALMGLVVFYPALPKARRLLVLAVALGLTFAANVLRMLVIIGAVGYGGQGWLDVAHVVFGRAVFFALAVAVYWFAVTRPTLRVVYARLREG
jgi:exosortase family protein XrtG